MSRWSRGHVTDQARTMLEHLPDGPLVGAEIGVHRGHTAGALLVRRPRLILHLVDSWSEDGEDIEGPHGRQHLAEAECVIERATEGQTWRARWLIGDSVEMAERVKDGDLDFCHVDADHRYPKVLRDIEAWWPKVRPGGLMFGHDIDHPAPEYAHWGVRRAVTEFASGEGLSFEVFAESMEWLIRKPETG